MFPEAEEQRCWNHRRVNVLDRLGKKHQPQAKVWLPQLMYAETREAATQRKRQFQKWCEQQGWWKSSGRARFPTLLPRRHDNQLLTGRWLRNDVSACSCP